MSDAKTAPGAPDNPAKPQPWDKLPGETVAAFRLFSIYRELSSNRSLVSAWEHEKAARRGEPLPLSPGSTLDNRGASDAKKDGRRSKKDGARTGAAGKKDGARAVEAPGHIRTWAKKHRWKARADAYDAHMEAIRLAARERETDAVAGEIAREQEQTSVIRARKRDEADAVEDGVADHLIYQSLRALEKLEPATLKPSEILAFLDRAVAIKDRVFGLPAGQRASIAEQLKRDRGADDPEDGVPRQGERNPYVQTVEIRLTPGKLHEDDGAGAPITPVANPDGSAAAILPAAGLPSANGR